MLSPKNFSPEQRQAIIDILNKKVMCITSDCGFGKTVVGLTAFAKIKQRFPNTKGLIVCTPEGVKGTWANEHKNWSHLTHLKVIPVIGNPKERTTLLNIDADLYAISYYNLKWLMQTNKKHNFRFVFVDEGDCLKGPTSKWRSYLLKSAPNAVWRIISTATPKARAEDDYWGLCKYMDGGEALGKTITDFREEYMTRVGSGRTTFYQMRRKKIPQLEKSIEHLFFNYDKSDNATVPIETITVSFSLSDESLAKYKELEKKQLMGSIVDVGPEQEKLSSLMISAKLDQLSHGFLYYDDNLRISIEDLENATSAKSLLNDTKVRKVIDVFDDRIKALKKLMRHIYKKHGDTPVIICYHHTHAKEQLLSLYPNALTDTTEDFVSKWNTGEYPVLLLQYSRSSKSLNLQKGGYVMVFYSATWKWVDDYQIIRRVARQGQPHPKVYAYRLYAKGTIDDVKAKRLDERFMGHSRFQKKILREIKNGKN